MRTTSTSLLTFAVLFAACADLPSSVVHGARPAVVAEGRSVAITIDGEGFRADAHVDYSDGDRLSDRVTVEIGDTVSFGARIVDEHTVVGDLPPLEIGTYSVSVTLADGRRAMRENALRVVGADAKDTADTGLPGYDSDAGHDVDADVDFTADLDDVNLAGDAANDPDRGVEQAVPLAQTAGRVDLTLGPGETDASADLGLLSATTVPFATVRVDDDTRSISDRLVDVSFDGTSVVAERGTALGTASVVVELVDFDPARVRVHAGAFSIGEDDVETRVAAALTTTGQAFVIFGTRVDGDGDGHGDEKLEVVTRGRVEALEAVFQRQRRGAELEGHYWIVEALDDAFSVATVELTSNETAVQVDIMTPPAQTMVLMSHRVQGFDVVTCSIAPALWRLNCTPTQSRSAELWVQTIDFGPNAVIAHELVELNPQVASMSHVLPEGGAALVTTGRVGMYGANRRLPATVGSSADAFTTIEAGALDVVVRRGEMSGRVAVPMQIVEWR